MPDFWRSVLFAFVGNAIGFSVSMAIGRIVSKLEYSELNFDPLLAAKEALMLPIWAALSPVFGLPMLAVAVCLAQWADKVKFLKFWFFWLGAGLAVSYPFGWIAVHVLASGDSAHPEWLWISSYFHGLTCLMAGWLAFSLFKPTRGTLPAPRGTHAS